MLKRKAWKFGIVALAVAAMTAAFAACGGGGDNGGDSDSGATSNAITVTMKDNAFDPEEFAVKAGEEVTITVTNEGKAVHNMHVLSKDKEGKDFSSAVTVNPGSQDVFKITLTKAGTMKFQCDYHMPDMVGKITVRQ